MKGNHLQLKEVEVHTNVDWSIGAGHLKLSMSALVEHFIDFNSQFYMPQSQ